MSSDYQNLSKDKLVKKLVELQLENNALKESNDKNHYENQRLNDKVNELTWMLEHAGDAAIYRGNYRTMQYEYWSPNVEQILGYTSDELFAMGQPGAVKLINPDDLIRLNNLLGEIIIKGGGPYSIEYRFTAKDGTIRYIDERGHAFVDENNLPLYAIGSVRNISELKWTENALKESEDLFGMFLKFSPIYVYIKEVTETESRVITASQNFIDMVGISGENMKGKTMQELFPDEFATKITADDFNVCKNGTVQKIEETLNEQFYTTIKFPIFLNGKTFLAGYTIDITERKQSEKMFQDIIDKNPISIQILDENGYTIQVNGAFMELFGVAPPPNYSIFNDPQLSGKAFIDAFENIKKGVVVKFPDSYYNTHDIDVTYPDNPKWLKVVGFSLHQNSKSPLKIVLMHENITERVLAENNLKKSEKESTELNILLNSILESPHDMVVFALDAEYRYITFNNAHKQTMKNTWGVTIEIGKNMLDCILDPNNREKAKDNFDRALKGLSFIIEEEYGDNALQRSYYENRYNPIYDENKTIIGVTVFVTDFTKRKQIELELLAAKETANANSANVTAIIEGTNDNIWAFDKNYRILYINQKFQREFNQTFGVKLEPGVSLIDALPEPLRQFWKPRYNKVLNNEQFTVEDAIDTELGTIYVQVSFNPIVKNGKVIGGSCFGSDITVRKVSEIELIKAKEKAEESDRLKSAFLANMSHEIRTPMNGILGFADLLKKPNLSGKQQQQYIQIIEKSGIRMLNIINDIIDISKIEAGLMKLNIRESNINEQIEYIYTFFKPEVEAKGMQLTFRNSLPLIESVIETDREKVYAILTNLVKNAIKYSEKGTIHFGYELVTINNEPFLQFCINDTGIGIPKNRQQAIFERFIQADIADKMARQGAGLGLSITKAYVEMLGGKIWVESHEGIGSAFYFTLPYTNTVNEKIAQKKQSNQTDNNSTDTKTLKILITEDDETSTLLISLMVKKYCKELLIVNNGIDAVETCKKHADIDVIFMDIQLPKLNGYEATKQIRNFNKNVVIIAQTAYGLSSERDIALEAGCNEYISKPISNKTLNEMIQKHIKSR